MWLKDGEKLKNEDLGAEKICPFWDHLPQKFWNLCPNSSSKLVVAFAKQGCWKKLEIKMFLNKPVMIVFTLWFFFCIQPEFSCMAFVGDFFSICLFVKSRCLKLPLKCILIDKSDSVCLVLWHYRLSAVNVDQKRLMVSHMAIGHFLPFYIRVPHQSCMSGAWWTTPLLKCLSLNLRFVCLSY